MLPDSRQRALTDILTDYERGGFNPQRIVTVFGLVRALVQILNDTTNTQRMSDAGALVMKTYEDCAKIFGRPQELACKKGCGYCCHTKVTMTVPEIFLLARAVRPRWEDAGNDFKSKYEKAEAATRTLSHEARQTTRTACPLLADNACSMYEARPLTCRAYGSKSLQACINFYNQLPNEVPQSEISQLLRAMIFAGLKAALKRSGLDDRGYELGHALQAALAPDAEARWLAGENHFADVTQEVRAAERSAGHKAFDDLVVVLAAGAFGEDVPANPWFQWPS